MDDLTALIQSETQRALEYESAVLEAQIFNIVLMYGLCDYSLHEAVDMLVAKGWCIMTNHRTTKLTGRRHFVQLRDPPKIGHKLDVIAMALPRTSFTNQSIEI